MTTQTVAAVYAALAMLPVAMHLGLAAGAPLGRFTAGGRFPWRLPPLWRLLALVQAALLVGMALAISGRGAVLDFDLPGPAFWLALALTLLSTFASGASPSRPERLLWTPVLLAMSAAAIGVAMP
ncbi:hypothetical protein [Tropicibacter sp. S64]|uniref:hypothetical protein n=1 Tax=Tropicibacter sp. S64 TaxID=3415122 RepID=UPI003C7C1C18